MRERRQRRREVRTEQATSRAVMGVRHANDSFRGRRRGGVTSAAVVSVVSARTSMPVQQGAQTMLCAINPYRGFDVLSDSSARTDAFDQDINSLMQLGGVDVGANNALYRVQRKVSTRSFTSISSRDGGTSRKMSEDPFYPHVQARALMRSAMSPASSNVTTAWGTIASRTQCTRLVEVSASAGETVAYKNLRQDEACEKP